MSVPRSRQQTKAHGKHGKTRNKAMEQEGHKEKLPENAKQKNAFSNKTPLRKQEWAQVIDIKTRIPAFLAAFIMVIWMTGCGLEVLMMGLPSGGTHEPPKPEELTLLQGKATGFGGADVVLKAGQVKVVSGKTQGDGSFSLELPKGTDFSNLILEITQGSVVLWAIVPKIAKGKTTASGAIDTKSTTMALVLQAMLSARGLEVFNYPADGMAAALQQLSSVMDQKDSLKRLLQMVGKINDAARSLSGNSILQPPQLKTTGNQIEVLQSALTNKDIDYCAPTEHASCKDGAEGATTALDATLVAAIQPTEFQLPQCNFQENIQVVFTVTIDVNKVKDGNCNGVAQFKHAKRYGGTSCEKCKVYLTGGVHKDSGFSEQQQQIAQQLGNWVPNVLEMYDDGTHGDLVAKDGIWTVTLTLPAPKPTNKACTTTTDCETGQTCWKQKCHTVLRLGYKYTYGLNGDVWGGTEEFPGNQRLLEVLDQNEDGFVARHDVFADETANKDKVNGLRKKGVTGQICFVTPPTNQCQSENPAQNHPDCGCLVDQDDDGIPDTRERPWDFDNDCKPDGYKVYANVQPLTISCSY